MFIKNIFLLLIISTVTFGISAQPSIEGESTDSVAQENGYVYHHWAYEQQVLMRMTWQFARATLSDDAETMRSFMIPEAEIRHTLNIFYDRLDFMILKGLRRIMKGRFVDDDADFDMIEASYEFLVSGEDSYTYLTINVKQTEDGWKVIWYGFEK
jgi:hypothetical protein